MKRRLITVLTIIVFSTMLLLTANANEAGGVPASMPDDMIEEEIAASIVIFINSITDESQQNVAASDIDFSRAYKIYVSYNVFDLDDNSFSQIINVCERSSIVIYEIPVFLENGDVYVANIERRMPSNENLRMVLSESELAEYELMVGKWVVSAMHQYLADDVPFVDYYEIVKESARATGADPIFVGGLPYFRTVVAIFPDENGDAGRLIPINPPAFLWYDSLSMFSYEYSQNGWLDYSTVKEYIRTHPPEVYPDLSGGDPGGLSNVTYDDTSFPWWIPVAIIGLIGLAAVFILKLKFM